MYKAKYKVIKGEEKDLRKVLNKALRERYKIVSRQTVDGAKLTLLVKEDFSIKTSKLMSLVLVIRIMDGKLTVYKYKTNHKSHNEIKERFINRIPYLLSQGKPIRKEDDNNEKI